VGAAWLERRTRYDIYADILEVIMKRGVMGVTRISYGANLPVDRAKEALEFLSERGMVKEAEYGGNKGYVITAKGGEYVTAHRTVKRFIDE
jgi:predicted transcriptional regulator